MLSGVVSFFTGELASDRYGAFAFDEPDDRGNGVFGWNTHAHVTMVRHDVAFDDRTFFLLGESVEYGTELFPDCTVEHLAPPLRHEYDMLFAIENGNAIGFDRNLTEYTFRCRCPSSGSSSHRHEAYTLLFLKSKFIYSVLWGTAKPMHVSLVEPVDYLLGLHSLKGKRSNQKQENYKVIV